MEHNIGSIEAGYDADLTFIKISEATLFPLIHHDEFSTIVHNLMFETKEEMIQHVMVKGKWVMKDRKITTIDEEQLNESYKKIINQIFGEFHI